MVEAGDVSEEQLLAAARRGDEPAFGLLVERHRARAAVEQRVPRRSQQAELAALGPGGRRALVDAFVAAWERADVPALLDLLAENARFTMPPLPAWFDGREDVGRFLAERVFAGFVDPQMHRHFSVSTDLPPRDR